MSPRAKQCRPCSLKRDYGDERNKRWRWLVMERDNFTCRKNGCERHDHLTPHHVRNFRIHKELRYDVANGITLCMAHHAEFHRRFGTFGNGWNQMNRFLKESQCESSLDLTTK